MHSTTNSKPYSINEFPEIPSNELKKILGFKKYLDLKPGKEWKPILVLENSNKNHFSHLVISIKGKEFKTKALRLGARLDVNIIMSALILDEKTENMKYLAGPTPYRKPSENINYVKQLLTTDSSSGRRP